MSEFSKEVASDLDALAGTASRLAEAVRANGDGAGLNERARLMVDANRMKAKLSKHLAPLERSKPDAA